MIFEYPLFLLLILPLWYIYKDSHKKNLLSLSILFMILSLANPSVLEKRAEETTSNQYIVAIDLSYSMMADDLKPNRFETAKELFVKLLDTHPKDSFALFGFTSNALILSPPTSDHTLLKSAIGSIKIENILSKSTNILSLLKRVAKLRIKEKNLIIFSDGGDRNNFKEEIEFAKDHHIKITVIGTATKKGAVLKDEYNRAIRDTEGKIVLSRLNPSLKYLAKSTGGEFYKYDSFNFSLPFESAKKVKKSQRGLNSLFWIPLLLAIALFLLHYIKIPKRLLMLLPFLTHNLEAGMLDWLHIHRANEAYNKGEFIKSARELELIEHKTMQSQIDLANSYYHAHKYKKAKSIYQNLKTNDLEQKRRILFMLGNTQAKLKEFDEAKRSYIKALSLKEDKKILHNLKLIIAKTTKHMDMPASKSKERADKNAKSAKKDTKTPKSKKNSKSNSKRTSFGEKGGSSKTTKHKSKSANSNQKATLTHPLGYKAYDTINKGYIDEKKPW